MEEKKPQRLAAPAGRGRSWEEIERLVNQPWQYDRRPKFNVTTPEWHDHAWDLRSFFDQAKHPPPPPKAARERKAREGYTGGFKATGLFSESAYSIMQAISALPQGNELPPCGCSSGTLYLDCPTYSIPPAGNSSDPHPAPGPDPGNEFPGRSRQPKSAKPPSPL